jgi:predicted secreted protein
VAHEGMKGNTILLLWNSAAVAGVKQKAIKLNGEAIDISADDDSGWRKLLTTSKLDSVDVTLSGVTRSQNLKTDWFAGTRSRTMTITYPSGGVISGTFFLHAYTDTGPFNDAATFEAQFQSTGTVTFTPGGS